MAWILQQRRNGNLGNRLPIRPARPTNSASIRRRRRSIRWPVLSGASGMSIIIYSTFEIKPLREVRASTSGRRGEFTPDGILASSLVPSVLGQVGTMKQETLRWG